MGFSSNSHPFYCFHFGNLNNSVTYSTFNILHIIVKGSIAERNFSVMQGIVYMNEFYDSELSDTFERHISPHPPERHVHQWNALYRFRKRVLEYPELICSYKHIYSHTPVS
jgi:hypothetical protein